MLRVWQAYDFSNALTAAAIGHQIELVNLLPAYATSIDVRFTAINLAEKRGTVQYLMDTTNPIPSIKRDDFEAYSKQSSVVGYHKQY